MSKILIVEDDIQLSKILRLQLEYHDFECENYYTALDVIENIQDFDNFDVVLLDLGLPDISGDVLCKKISSSSTTPVIVVSATHSVEEKVKLLTSGASDYVTKPFDIHELVARINIQINKKSNSSINYYNLTLNLDKFCLFKDNEPIDLSRKEFDLICFFIKNKEQVLEREDIISNVWGWNASDNLLDVTIKNLRKKLKHNYIQTARGFGYMLMLKGKNEI